MNTVDVKITRNDWTPEGDLVEKYELYSGDTKKIVLTSSKLDSDMFTIEIEVK